MNTTLYASDYAILDSNVITGGGTDQTEILQGLLDKALEWGRVKLVMDGAALIRGLQVHSNTTIECMDKSCGFYLADGSDCAVLCNANRSFEEIKTFNVTLIGGTYNHNCLHQAHDVPETDPNLTSNSPDNAGTRHWTVAMEFYGIENLNVRELTVRDQRTFAFTVGNFRHVNVENTFIELVNEIPYGNQDGFHFWGPGQFLNVLHSGGKVGDDIINVGPDEGDGYSSITDVLIDGIFVDDGEQAVRLLSRGTGRLDRVTVRNVTGVYRSYGFYINPWFVDDACGNFGNILIENVDLKSVEKTYSAPPFLFSVGGNIECLTLKNIRHHAAHDNRPVLDIGWPFYLPNRENYKMFEKDTPYHTCRHRQRLQNIIVDGLTIVEQEDDPKDTNYISVYDKVENMIIKNVTVIKNQKENGNLLYFEDQGMVQNLVLEGIHTKGLKNIINDETKVKNRF